MTDPDDPDLRRAVDCPVCQAAGVENHVPSPPNPKPAEEGRRALRRLTHPQAQFLRQVWDYLASARPGGNPDERVLALVCLLRAARTGQANLTAQDVRGLRVGDPHATVAALTTSGWLETTPEAVLAADAASPAACALPEFHANPWGVGRKVRARTSGWSTGILAHKLLRKKSNAVRLTALYLTAHAEPDGSVEFHADHLIGACALDGVDELMSALGELVAKGWLAGLPSVGATSVSGHLGETVAPLAPKPPPEEPPSADAPASAAEDTDESDASWPELDAAATVAERARILVTGHEADVAHWVRQFRAEHGHGPKWATVAAAQDWPPQRHPHRRATEVAFVLLAEEGWLDGLGRPYGLRPGPQAEPEHAG